MLRLVDEEYRGAVQISWSTGGLHFSQLQEVISPIGPKANFLSVSLNSLLCVYYNHNFKNMQI